MEDPNYNNCVKYIDILLVNFCINYGFQYKENDPIAPYKSISINNKKYCFSINQYFKDNIPYKLEYRTNEKTYYGVIDIYDEITTLMISEYEAQKKLL